MVHRPADSRLLTNLLAHEKEYSKALSNVFDVSQTAIASFSAYASASAPPTSQVIAAVAGALAGADAALRNYAVSVEQWQTQLKTLKDMEDEVGNVMRDREILVTRLIKASNKQKSNRDSVPGASPSSSTLSFKTEVQVGTKMSSAQAELQACEAHLAAKERELDILRTSTIRNGLQIRCKAMVECGWSWGEIGKEALRALEGMDAPNGHGNPGSHLHSHDARLSLDHAASDLSSIAPSQSASQRAPGSDQSHQSYQSDMSWPDPVSFPRPSAKPYSLHIPAAHSMNYFTLPNAHAPSPISEEESGAGSSAEDEEPGQVEIHENERFAKRGSTAKILTPNRHIRFPTTVSSSVDLHKLDHSPSRQKDGERHRSPSLSVFGSIAAFLRKGHSGSHSDDSSINSSKGGSRWHSRIDKNLKKTGRDDYSSDEDAAASNYRRQASTLSSSFMRSTESPLPLTPLTASPSTPVNGTARPKKKTLKRNSVPVQASAGEKGWASDGATVTKAKGKKKAGAGLNGNANPSALTNGTPGAITKKRAASAEPDSAKSHDFSDVNASLSRNSSLSKQSMLSVASAPSHTTAAGNSAPTGRTPTGRKRNTISGPSPKASPNGGTPGHRRTASMSGPPMSRSGLTRTNDEPSLMSIVENVSRHNKEAWMKQDPSRMLITPKAPPPVNISLELESISNLTPTPMTPRAAERRPSITPVKESISSRTLTPASASAPSLAISHTHTPKRPSTKTPLRSALRNGSRTPSPNPPTPPPPSLDAALESRKFTTGIQTSSPTPARSAPANTLTPISESLSRRRSLADDASSVSSYETTHEVFDEDTASDTETPPPPPPSNEKPHHHVDGSDVSRSTNSSTSTAAPPVRRKSVRMSLPPTFSATPPALDDDEESQRARPWSDDPPRTERSNGWASKVEENGIKDVWEDSSDEDEDYKRAKKMLARISKKKGAR